MKAAGIIVEYNPFHNGHLYHLEQTKKETNADVLVAVMSGNFLQRGEPAITSKWSRTRMALRGGCDLVIELPYAFATQKAETFAYGSVALLHAMQVKEICFGSENGSIDDFLQTLSFITNHKEEYNENIRSAVKKGISYPKATAEAFKALSNSEQYIDLSQPNNILGFHYIKAIQDLKSTIKPKTIKRTNANYHDQTFSSDTIASATSIRRSIFKQHSSLAEVKDVIPASTLEELQNYQNNYSTLHQWENYFSLLKYKVLTLSKLELKNIYEVEEGLENRLVNEMKYAETFAQFMEQLKTKRYTWTRLQRVCTHVLCHTSKTQMKESMKRPNYIRLLGMSEAGQNYLSSIKKDLTLPVLSKLSSFNHPQLELDIKASYTYASCLKEPLFSQFIKNEFSTPPIRYNSKDNIFI